MLSTEENEDSKSGSLQHGGRSLEKSYEAQHLFFRRLAEAMYVERKLALSERNRKPRQRLFLLLIIPVKLDSKTISILVIGIRMNVAFACFIVGVTNVFLNFLVQGAASQEGEALQNLFSFAFLAAFCVGVVSLLFYSCCTVHVQSSDVRYC